MVDHKKKMAGIWKQVDEQRWKCSLEGLRLVLGLRSGSLSPRLSLVLYYICHHFGGGSHVSLVDSHSPGEPRNPSRSCPATPTLDIAGMFQLLEVFAARVLNLV